ncbi:tetratricopeptide repeat protein [Flavobacterium jejuense]|uniref:Tetratricopeptide repeat protein n=1 Tax=Flavobacterium jejuense TaxID=1544455 RepID=A0ABX0IM36_9FLAO|nr:tetratricopeptide repeat protein [Flavobacterium jejuense]NHN24872.1 tetratricopeptide repeat protein [Flavobacterium jejuense]
MRNQTIKLSILLLFIFFIFSCNSKEQLHITKKKEYKEYLTNKKNSKLENIKKDIAYWQKKYNDAPNQYTYLITLSGLYAQLFEINGTIKDLYYSEKLLLDCNNRIKGEKAGIHRSIAKNYISQHRFKEALSHLENAYELGENKKGTNKMLFDVHMELGNYDLAKDKLSEILDYKDFDYLIRLAKWNDHNGNLDKAIEVMEKAMKMAEASKNNELRLWIYSNIADFYGHAGRIQDSYNYYLKTLEIDNNNMYALKGIAWIAFSHEKNTKQAIEIINYIESKHLVPDLYLLKADIYDYEGDARAKQIALNDYFRVLSENDYGDMYNKYNALLFAETPGETDKALMIAEKEIFNRPTPESYDLLAWVYYNIGDYKNAYDVISKHTLNKSHEPLIIYHNELILKANNMLNEKNSHKEELLESIYELGPNLEKQIITI